MTLLRHIAALALAVTVIAACGTGADEASSDAADSAATPGGGAATEPAAETEAAQADPVTITWASTGGAFSEAEVTAVHGPYEEATGNTIEAVAPADIAQLQAMVESERVTWDVVTMPWHFGALHCGELFQPLDPERFDFSVYPEGTYGDCYAPIGRVGWIFSYNADSYPDNPPTSIADFFDTENFPGQRILLDSPHNILESALVADGVAPEELYPLDLDRAFAKMDEIKDDLTIAPTYGAIEQAMVGGQADMTIAVTARTVAIADQGVNLEPVWDFTMAGQTVQMVVAGSPNAETAQEVIAFAHEPEQAIAYAEETGLWPARTDIDPEQVDYTETQQKFNAFAGERGTVIPQDSEWYSERIDEAIEAWTNWTVG